ncbi:MAG: HAD family hydrolase [Pseudomonadota bacterium]
MALAIFDLDNTLIAGDSDNLWGKFLCDEGLVDAESYSRHNDQFYSDYQAGTLDIDAYLRFALSSLIGVSAAQRNHWHQSFMQRMIEPILLPAANTLLEKHRKAGDELLIITATNRFITEPIAALLGVDNLIACEGEIIDGVYTGKPAGTPSYADGKVVRLQRWLKGREIELNGAWFYSDSHNDLPLLKIVDHPVAVDPDDTLREIALKRDWTIISLRDQ